MLKLTDKKKIGDGVYVHVDLPKKRQSVLKEAKDLVRNKGEVLFCYVDINCMPV